MLGFWYSGGYYDPDFERHWQHETPPPLSPEAQQEKLLHEFEQILTGLDKRHGMATLVDQLETELGRLRPGGSWTTAEENAVKRARGLVERLRKVAE